MKWNKFTLRKTDSEEKEYFGCDEIWDSPLPDNEEVPVPHVDVPGTKHVSPKKKVLAGGLMIPKQFAAIVTMALSSTRLWLNKITRRSSFESKTHYF